MHKSICIRLPYEREQKKKHLVMLSRYSTCCT
jgi:hypothetical protein